MAGELSNEEKAFQQAIEAGLGMDKDKGVDADDGIDENEGSYSDDLDDDEEGAPADDESGDEGLGDDDEIGRGDPGGAAGQGLERAKGKVPEAPVQSPPPPGFQNWDHYRWAQEQHAQQQQAAFQQQQQHYQQQLQARQPQGFQWNLPHQRNPEVEMAMKLRGTEQFKNLSPHIQNQAEELYGYVQGNWDRWTYDPVQHARDVALPEVAKRYDPEILSLREKVAALEAEAFKRKHADDLPSPDAMQRYLGVVDEMRRDPYQAGLKFVQLTRALEDIRAERQTTKTKATDDQARKRSARGKPAHQGRSKGRRGNRQKPLAKEDRTNASLLAEAAKQMAIESGDYSPSDFGE